MNGSTSDPQSISFGVPQGSLIGPLFFVIYSNDVPSVVKHSKIQLYADDTLLYVSSSSISDIEPMLSEDLKHIIEKLNNNFLYLNYSKTKVMSTGTHQRLALVDSFTVRTGDTVLSRVYQFKYLGVMLDPYLSWNEHIHRLVQNIVKLGMLRKARKVIPRESCLTLYNAMILPVINYCAVFWTPAVRMTESTWISCIGVPPVLLKATQSHNR